MWEKEKKLKESLSVYENFVKEQQDKLDKALEQDLDLAPVKSKHSKLIGLKAKMENNRDRHVSDIDFFSASGNCPTCHQEIEQEFANRMIEKNNVKIGELNDGLNKIAEQIETVLSEIEKIDEILTNINQIKMDLSSAKSTYKIGRAHV